VDAGTLGPREPARSGFDLVGLSDYNALRQALVTPAGRNRTRTTRGGDS